MVTKNNENSNICIHAFLTMELAMQSKSIHLTMKKIVSYKKTNNFFFYIHKGSREIMNEVINE